MTFSDGLGYLNYSIPDGITFTGDGSIGGITWASFNISQIAPSTQTWIFVNATTKKCSNMNVNATVATGCFGVECSKAEDSSYAIIKDPVVQINVNVPDPVKMCQGNVISNMSIIVKGETSIYNLKVNFTPFAGMNVTGIILDGTMISFDKDANGNVNFTIDTLKVGENIIPVFNMSLLSCCNLTPSQAHAKVSYQTSCQKAEQSGNFTLEKYSNNLQVLYPRLEISKTDQYVSASNKTTVCWVINVTNNGDDTAHAVNITDTLPSNTVFNNTNCTNFGGSGTSGDPFWCYIGNMSHQSDGENHTVSIQVCANVSHCTTRTTNNATVCYGCPTADCNCTIGCNSNLSYLYTNPYSYILNVSTEPVGTCEVKNVTVLINNTMWGNASAKNLRINITLTNGLRFYNSTNAGWWVSGNTTQVNFSTADNTTLIWNESTQGYGILNLTFQVRLWNPDNLCTGEEWSGMIKTNLTYSSTCGNVLGGSGNAYNESSVAFKKPNVSIILEPDVANAPFIPLGEIMRWNLTINNSGNGTAYKLNVTMTLGNGYSDISAENLCGAPASVNSNTITWSDVNITEFSNCTANISAKNAGVPKTVNVETHGKCCGDGNCCNHSDSNLTWDYGDVPYLVVLYKIPSSNTTEPGNFTNFTVKVQNPSGQNVTNINITDLLPSGWKFNKTLNE
ncbi:MAG: hypothetical protein CVT89_03930, partial [Candidatus Altiarchaeales archaeon HGW-Altiarchaeales-2]